MSKERESASGAPEGAPRASGGVPEPPFKFTQLFVVVIFVLLGIFAAKKFANEQFNRA